MISPLLSAREKTKLIRLTNNFSDHKKLLASYTRISPSNLVIFTSQKNQGIGKIAWNGQL